MKGISPLIAVIMLIAFALVVSGIFYSWVFQFTQSHREELQICSKAKIAVQDSYYNNATGNINIMVYNTGTVSLKGFVVLVSSTGANDPRVIRDFLDKDIDAEDIGLLPVPYDANIESIAIQSIECKNAQDMVKIYDVEGL